MIEDEERRVREEKENWQMAEEERMLRECLAAERLKIGVVDEKKSHVEVIETPPMPLVAPDRIVCRSRVVGPGIAKIAMQVIP